MTDNPYYEKPVSASTDDVAEGAKAGLAWYFDMPEDEAALIEVGVASTTGDGPAVMVMAWAVNPELHC